MSDWPIPSIDPEKCTRCGLCIAVCPNKALALVDGLIQVPNPEECAYTGRCEMICPEKAISRKFWIVFDEDKKE